jgi:hypothetical protein
LLTADWVTNSSSAARVKLRWRAAASNARRVSSGGRSFLRIPFAHVYQASMSLVGPGGKTNNPVIATARRNFMYAMTIPRFHSDLPPRMSGGERCSPRLPRRWLPAMLQNSRKECIFPALERTLAKNQLLVLPDAATTLVCMEGELWLTRDGDIEDYILGPGKSFAARAGDRVTVQALRPSRLRLDAA